MITPFDIYLISKLDAIRFFFVILVAMSAMYAFIHMAMLEAENDPEKEAELKKGAKKWLLIALIPLLTALAIPSTKEAVAIYLIPNAVNSKTTSNILEGVEKSSELFKEKINGWLNDVVESNKKGDK